MRFGRHTCTKSGPLLIEKKVFQSPQYWLYRKPFNAHHVSALYVKKKSEWTEFWIYACEIEHFQTKTDLVTIVKGKKYSKIAIRQQLTAEINRLVVYLSKIVSFLFLLLSESGELKHSTRNGNFDDIVRKACVCVCAQAKEVRTISNPWQDHVINVNSFRQTNAHGLFECYARCHHSH